MPVSFEFINNLTRAYIILYNSYMVVCINIDVHTHLAFVYTLLPIYLLQVNFYLASRQSTSQCIESPEQRNLNGTNFQYTIKYVYSRGLTAPSTHCEINLT